MPHTIMEAEKSKICRWQDGDLRVHSILPDQVWRPEDQESWRWIIHSESESEDRRLISELKNSEAERKVSFLLRLLFYSDTWGIEWDHPLWGGQSTQSTNNKINLTLKHSKAHPE